MKKRLIGAVVLIALAAIVLPFILKNQGANRSDIANLKLPAEPIYQVPQNMMSGIDKSLQTAGKTVSTTTEKISEIELTSDKLGEGNADQADAVVGSIGTTQKQTQAPGSLGFRLPSAEEREEKSSSASSNTTTVAKNESTSSTSSTYTSSSSRATSTPPAKPTPAPTITDVDNILPGYAVQLLSTPISQRAKEFKTIFIKEGYATFIMQFDNNGKTYNRVRIGTYPTKAEAEKLQDELKRRYTKNKYVQSSFVVHHQ